LQKKVDFVDTSTSAVAKEAAPVAPAPVTPVVPSQGIPQSALASGEEGADDGASDEQLAPAMALVDTLLQSIDEQTHSANDKVVGVMWRSLYTQLWKGRAKIAKKMIDDAK
jgi:hypothetical protein